MRVFKISAYSMASYEHDWDFDTKQWVDREIIPGIKVCSKSKLGYVGVITHVGPKTKRYPSSEESVKEVTVMWLTGPHKGKSQEKDVRDISNFGAYKDAVLRHAGEIAKIEEEASQTGM